MSNDAYLRRPGIAADRIVLLTEDDLFEVAASGGRARRLTFFGAGAEVRACTPDGRVLVETAAPAPLRSRSWAYA